MLQEKFLELNGVRLYYEVFKRNPPIVYLHGAINNHSVFNHQRSHFHSVGFGTLAPDQRGDGKSTPRLQEQEAYTLQAYTADLERLIDTEGIEKATIVGHSKGSMVAQAYAANHPEKVDALVLISSSYNFPDSFSRTPLRRLLFYASQVMPTTAYNAVSGLFIRDREGYYPDFSLPPFTAFGDFRILLELGRKSSPEYVRAMNAMGAALNKWDTRGIVVNVRAPTLIIHGGSDFLVPSKTAYELQEMIPGARNISPVIIPNARHGVHFQQPEQVNAAMEKFLVGEIYHGRLGHKL